MAMTGKTPPTTKLKKKKKVEYFHLLQILEEQERGNFVLHPKVMPGEFWLSRLGRMCYWHLVGRRQGGLYPTIHKTTKNYPTQNVNRAEADRSSSRAKKKRKNYSSNYLG